MIVAIFYLAGILCLSCQDSLPKYSKHKVTASKSHYIQRSYHDSPELYNRMRKALRKKSLVDDIYKYSTQIGNKDETMRIYGLLDELRKYGDSCTYGNALSMMWRSNGGWKNKDGVCIRNRARLWQMMVENDSTTIEMIVKHIHVGLGMSTPPETTLIESMAIDSIVRQKIFQRFSLKLPPLKDPLFYKKCNSGANQ